MTSVVHITDSNFSNEVLTKQGLVLIDFWASWCQPCIQIGPTIESIAQEYQNQLSVGKVNVDEEAKIAGQFGIRSIPTMILFKNGTAIDQVIGAVPKAKIEEMIKKHIS